MKRIYKPIAFVLVLMVATGMPLMACKKKERAPEPPPPENETELYLFPYTGIITTDEALTTKRPLMVKIENSPQARPQTGLNSADVIYETMIEGNESRFNCIFQSKIPKQVGPVRSARLSDLWLVPQYRGILFFSGANKQVMGRLKSDKINLMSHDTAEPLYHRIPERTLSHDLYCALNKAYKYVKKHKKFKIRSKDMDPLFFGQDSQIITTTSEAIDETTGVPESSLEGFDTKEMVSVTIPFYHPAKWKWDEESQVFLRWTKDEEHMDAAGDKQLWCDNVVIMWARYIEQSDIVDTAGSPTYDTDLGSGGDALVFRDGQMIKCTWEASLTTTPRLIAKDGSEVPLKPGKTYFTIPWSGANLDIEFPIIKETTGSAVVGDEDTDAVSEDKAEADKVKSKKTKHKTISGSAISA